LLLPSVAWAQQYTGGPSVRVITNVQVEFKWITNVVFFGKVEVFNNPDGTGTPVLTGPSIDALGNPIAAFTQDIIIPVGPPLAADTKYFFRVTATDPTHTFPDLVTPTPLPPFFTGAQVLTNVNPTSITSSSATIAWQANVIGFGQVAYGISSLSATVLLDCCLGVFGVC
jgi:hypothetical protein